MFGQSVELLILALVLGLAIGGGAVFSFFYILSKSEDKKEPHNVILPHEDAFNEREAELDEEKHSA